MIDFEFNFGRSVLNLPGACLPMLSSASAEQLRVLIALASENGKTAEGLCALADISAERVANAVAFWEKAGVLSLSDEISVPSAPAQTGRAAYTGADMARICESSEMQELLAVCSAILGKTFTPTETESVFYLYDGLRLDFANIATISASPRSAISKKLPSHSMTAVP